MIIRSPQCPKCKDDLDGRKVAGSIRCPGCKEEIDQLWFYEEIQRLNPSGVKEFVLDGRKMTSVDAFFDEAQRALCPAFKGFGRNWAAFEDILRGGFGQFELGESIRIRIIHPKKAKKYLEESQWGHIMRIIERSENVELIQ